MFGSTVGKNRKQETWGLSEFFSMVFLWYQAHCKVSNVFPVDDSCEQRVHMFGSSYSNWIHRNVNPIFLFSPQSKGVHMFGLSLFWDYFRYIFGFSLIYLPPYKYSELFDWQVRIANANKLCPRTLQWEGRFELSSFTFTLLVDVPNSSQMATTTWGIYPIAPINQ